MLYPDTNAFTNAEKTKLGDIQAGAQVNVATNISQGTRTDTTVSINSSTGTGATLTGASTTEAGIMTAADKVKLTGIATGATVNQTDAYLLNRANHTGVQSISTIDGLQTALNEKQTTLISGTNIKTINGGSLLGSGNLQIASSSINYSTAQTLSGTSNSFVSIPDDAKRITLLFNNVATNGGSSPMIRVGVGTTLQTSNYLGSITELQGTTVVSSSHSIGFSVSTGWGTSVVLQGSLILTRLSGNTWIVSGTTGRSAGSANNTVIAGAVTLSGPLNILNITTTTGTTSFTSGTANIFYEI